MVWIWPLAGLAVGVIAALLGIYVVVPRATAKTVKESEEKAAQMIKDARRESDDRAQRIIREAKDEASTYKKETEREVRKRQKEFDKREQIFFRSEEKLHEQLEKVDRRRAELDRRSSNIDKRESKVDEREAEIEKELQRVAELDMETASKEVLAVAEEESRYEAAQLRQRIEDETKNEATEIARQIIVKAIFRCAVDHYSDSLITSVEIKNDEMKGRIIGREGRNIRAIEAATGVDVIIDDTPNVVVLSSFDGVRREVARQALERLIQDGRIHPAKIEEIVETCRESVDEEIWRAGQEATFRTGITGLHQELIRMLGKLKYRTSYGQNVLAHSIEVAILAGIIAAELGLNPKNAKRGGLLHDIGKAADPEIEGSHAEIGGRFCKKFGENSIVVNCAEGHHGDVEQTIESAIVQVADAISAVRPGARGEALQSYLQRLHELEDLGNSFAGVSKCYAISAGRELRVLVKPEQMDDVLTYDLCRQIKQRIEDELEYPGTIKVTVIRETREVATAK
ncbi:ribonuclease Y [bacterium]|nr:ribonuclease Y [bacterium]